MYLSFLFLATALTTGTAPKPGWKADPAGAKIQFQVKGPFGTVHGSLSGLRALIQFNEKALGRSTITASVDAKTISTGIGFRNSDLNKKPEWLNTAKFPLIQFKSQKIIKSGPHSFLALGQLTIKGITRPVKIPFKFSSVKNSGHFKGGFTINREDYRVGNPGGSVGSLITITLDVPVRK